MAHWIARLQHRRQQREIDQAALQVVAQGHGVAARTWLVSPATTAAECAAIQDAAHAWLGEQIGVAASPYGWSNCTILIGLTRIEGDARTPLWKATLPAFSKADRAAGLVTAQTQLAALPLAAYPPSNQFEIYLLDLGAVLRDAFAAIDA